MHRTLSATCAVQLQMLVWIQEYSQQEVLWPPLLWFVHWFLCDWCFSRSSLWSLGYCLQISKQRNLRQSDSVKNSEPTPPAGPVPVYEELVSPELLTKEKDIELNENVAYGNC